MPIEQIQTVPVRRGWPLLGSLPEFLSHPSKDYFKRVMLDQGGLVRLNFGPQSVYIVSDPDYFQHILRDNYQNYRKPDMLYATAREVVGQGLVTSTGNLWLRQRRMIQPHLHRKQLVHLFDQMRGAVVEILGRWDEFAQRHSEVEMGEKMAEITITVITQALFGRKILSSDEIGLVGQCAIRLMSHMTHALFNGFLPNWFPKPKEVTFNRDQEAMRQIINHVIVKSRAEKESSASLIEMMLNAVDEETNQTMTEQQLYDEIMTIFLAGYETTSVALTWLLVAFKEHPEVLEKLQAEIDQILGNRLPSFEEILRLAYSQKVFMEVLRYYTVVSFLPRALNNPDKLGPYALPANALVLLSFYGVHHNPRVWENPEVFDPERFAPETIAHRHPFAYLPFSAGPRQCAGNEFAMLEGPLIIGMLLQHYKIALLPNQTLQTDIWSLRPKDGVKAMLSFR